MVNIPPVKADANPSIVSWLESCNYPQYRKDELLKLYNKNLLNGWDFFRGLDPGKMAKCNSFAKDEGYKEFKHGRSIYSRSDSFKVFSGPWFRLIEQELFKYPWFIKKVPVDKRSKFIHDRYSYNAVTTSPREHNLRVINTDYTAYESSFSQALMEAIEFELYDHMLSLVPGGLEAVRIIKRVLTGVNICRFKYVVAKILSKRMSGEMNTSLGNSFANLMVFKFMMQENHCTDVQVLVEGDDLLGQYVGPMLTSQDYARFGLIVKLNYSSGPNEMSFCGQLYDPESLITITDPIKVILNFGWTYIGHAFSNNKNIMKLIRAKALSNMVCYSGSPIIQSMAMAYERLTRGYGYRVVGAESLWKMRNLSLSLSNVTVESFYRPVATSARYFMERVYGVSVDHQRSIENYFNRLTRVAPIYIPCMHQYLTAQQCHYSSIYVQVVSQYDALNSTFAVGNQRNPVLIDGNKNPIWNPGN